MPSSSRKRDEITLLIAEDDGAAREMLQKTLPRRFPGVKALVASNGEEGLKLFLRHTPEIVLTDIAMPIMDGFAMAREISSRRPETVIIAISAHSSREFRDRIAEAGIVQHVEKPIDLRRLFAEIETGMTSVLEKRAAV